MYRQLITAACALDFILALLFTQLGMFLVGRGHSLVQKGLASGEFAPGLSIANVAALALVLAVCLIVHGFWCWRRFKTLGPEHAPKPLEFVLSLAAPVAALGIGVAVALLHGL